MLYHNSVTRTLYIGNLYEEDITPGHGKAYTSYYWFGGKLVGMRKVEEFSSKQYRVVGDRQGSTTLLVDTSTAPRPQVVQRTYYKPYGEVAWPAPALLPTAKVDPTKYTSIGYTGQRLEKESGLMNYGGRFYDPVLSYFVSADPVSPDPNAPRSRNRYSYVLNNPPRYTDPSGYRCTDPNAGSAVEEHGSCEDNKRHLEKFGFTLNLDDWTWEELVWMIEAINDLLRAAGRGAYDYTAFRALMNIADGESVELINLDNAPNDYVKKKYGHGQSAGNCQAMCVDPLEELGNGSYSTKATGRYLGYTRKGFREKFDSESLVDQKTFFKYMFVHELGHVMDNRRGGLLSRHNQVVRARNGEKPVNEAARDGGVVEQWGETVASTVYPGVKVTKTHGDYNPIPNQREFTRRVLNILSFPTAAYSPH